MRNRRFAILAAVLVTLNVGLWVVPQGLALQRVVVATLFGKNMVRAEVVVNSGADWRIDRGTVVSATPTLLTIHEADGKVQAIVVSSSTRVTGSGKSVGVSGLKPGWRVLVTWPGPSGTADAVVIEKHGSGGSGG